MSSRILAKHGIRRAISLLELMAVFTIVGILSMVIVPNFIDSNLAEERMIDQRNKSAINAAVERWYIQHGEWPATDLSDIAADPEFFPIGLPKNPLYGNAYTLDPKTHWAR